MGFLSVLSCAHKWVEERAGAGDVAVDATVGNGNDTLFLLKTVGPAGTVYGFDIQAEALERTRRKIADRLPEAVSRLHLHQSSHADMLRVIPAQHIGRVAAVMFNLGYLPHGDRTVITRPETTLPALEASLALLRPGGILTIVVYPGHPGGKTEADAVERWAASLGKREFQSLCYRFLHSGNDAPYLIAVEAKKRSDRK